MRVVAGIPPADLPPFAYVPLGFRPHGGAEMSPTYPIGLPLAVLATAQLTGWSLGPHATMLWHALLGVALTYWLGRIAGVSKGLSLVGALMLATSPLYLFTSTTLMSDTPALVWTTAAVLLAWRSRDAPRLAALAGAAVATAVLVRPTNVLVLAPVAACLGLSPRRWAWLCAGGSPGAVVLLLYNSAAYGNPLTTGYGDVGSAFALANVPASLRTYAEWLHVELTPLVVLAPGLPMLSRRSPRLVAVLALWIAGFCGLYAFYYNTHEAWWYLRFLLPAFPPLLVAVLLVGRRLLDLLPADRWFSRSPALAAAGLTVAVLVLAHNVSWVEKLEAAEAGRGERAYYEAATWARAHLPANSALVAGQTSGALFHYTDLPLLRWDMLPQERFALVVAALQRRRQPLYAVLFPFEVEDDRVLSERLPGAWTQVGAVRHVTIWRFDGPRPAITSSVPPRGASGAGTR
jgi:4-amino-4-deoxy-L-arabinose transferase-like glycosyltransferase